MSAERKLMGTTDGGGDVTYIEDVFSTYLYTGTGAAQTITNGIDLSTKGGLVWLKSRSGASQHGLYDTLRGVTKTLSSDQTAAQTTDVTSLTAFNTNGFSIGAFAYYNNNADTYTSWTFRKQAKFFDVVTYTGNGGSKTINHSLGVTPGMVIIKRTDNTSDWVVWHRSFSLANTAQGMRLNTTDAFGNQTGAGVWGSTSPMTATTFYVAASSAGTWNTNLSGASYVAYLFAHDAGGFGASGTDNVISCGSYTGNGSTTGPSVTLGYEPQYVMVKASSTTGNWVVLDVMRGMSQTNSQELFPNLSSAEAALNPSIIPTATGFTIGTANADLNSNTVTYIYIAIRRGPMRTPTSGTSVFSPITVNAAAGTKSTTGFPVDMQIMGIRPGAGNKGLTSDRLRGVSTTATDGGTQLITSSTAAETTANAATLFWDNTGFQMPINASSSSDIFWNFGRAPGFFDVVCYTGTGAVKTVNHNLGVAPEMMIIKSRASATQWGVYHAALGATKGIYLNGTGTPVTASSFFNDTSPTSSLFTVNFSTATGSATNYVAYLFASCPSVSKVGSYTGTGAAQTINCGFTAGARFVLIKRTDSAGDWYTWDSARGIIAGNDPHLSLNTTAAEVTTNDSIDPDSTGFIVNQVAATNINVSSASYIFLAIA